jgi:hypothetical protein
LALNTTQNRALILAQFLRGATAAIQKVRDESCFCIRCQEARDQALEKIDSVAEELEAVADMTAPPLVVSKDERRAIEDVLKCAGREMAGAGRWGYFAPGGWAGDRLTALLSRIPQR